MLAEDTYLGWESPSSGFPPEWDSSWAEGSYEMDFSVYCDSFNFKDFNTSVTFFLKIVV